MIYDGAFLKLAALADCGKPFLDVESNRTQLVYGLRQGQFRART